MTKEAIYLGIDLGATTVKAGVVANRTDVLAGSSTDTAGKTGDKVLQGIISSARQAVSQAGLTLADLAGLGVASPGPIDLKAGIICDSPNIEGWKNIPLAKLLSEALGMPAVLENDANAAALGEYHYLAEPGLSVLALYTLGTGIGGGVVIDGKALHGANGFAAEMGHVIVEPGGRTCGCGQRGCVEAYASAKNTALRAVEALQQGRASSLAKVLEERGELTSRDVVEHARAGDALAAEILDRTAYYLALLSVAVWHILDPQKIVLGGGMAQAGDILLQAVRKHFNQQRWKLQGTDRIEIVLAKLGNQAGIIGAANAAATAFGD